MKTKLLLFYVLAECVYVEGTRVINSYQDEVNAISQDDRRAAESTEIKSVPDLYASPSSYQKNNVYLPPSYESSGYDHNSGYTPYYYQPPTYYNPPHHEYEEYDHGGGSHKGHDVSHGSQGSKSSFFSALALKGILIPLAGIALLGAAAALSTNPVLLQLGAFSGRRKRRSLFADNVYPVNPNLKPTVVKR